MTRLWSVSISLSKSLCRDALAARGLIYLCCFLFLATPAAEWSEENGECQAGGEDKCDVCVMALEGVVCFTP